MGSEKPGFFQELKRRHVWRVAAAYAIAAWLLVQIATQVFPFFDIPNWAVRLVVLGGILGFPAAVVLAWVYEITPDGIRRTEPATSAGALDPRVQYSMGHKLNAIIVGALVLAVIAMGWRMYAADRRASIVSSARVPSRNGGAAGLGADGALAAPASATPEPASDAAVATVPGGASEVAGKSVAVLPFANESGNKDEQFFSDGLSQDLINALSQFAGLKVISRNSAFQFRDSRDSAAEIGRKLGVAHLLEGSVQRIGKDVRITATLVSAADGSIVWSQHYDRPYQDLFALQDAITQAVGGALKTRLVVAPGAVVQSDRPPSGNLAAYAAYQRGVAYLLEPTEASTRRAIDAFDDATRLDPRYAAAYAGSSLAWVELFGAWGVPAPTVDARARAALDTALKLDPDSSLAHQVRARFLQLLGLDWRGAEAEARRALQLAPNDAHAKIMLGLALAKLGQVQRAADLTREALESNPRQALWYLWLTRDLSALGHLDEAGQAIRTAIDLQPGGDTFYTQLAIVEVLRGDAAAALAAARRENDRNWREWALAQALQIGPDRAAADGALKSLIAEQGNTFAYTVAQVYALRGDADQVFEWLERAWIQRDPGVGLVLADPLLLRYRHDPRFAAFCTKIGLPTTTDAVAMK